MKRRKFSPTSFVIGLVVLAVAGGLLAENLVLPWLRSRPTPEQARTEETIRELFRRTGGDMRLLTPVQYEMMRQYRTTGIVSEEAARQRVAEKLADITPAVEARLRKYWAPRGVKWNELTEIERYMLIEQSRRRRLLPRLPTSQDDPAAAIEETAPPR